MIFRALGPKDIMKVSLTDVEAAIGKHTGPNVEPKGIKAHFLMDDSGLLNLGNVDYTVEKLGDDEPSTLEKIGSGLSQLFGGGFSSYFWWWPRFVNNFDQVRKNLQKTSRKRIRHLKRKAALKLTTELARRINRNSRLLILLTSLNHLQAMKRIKWIKNLKLFWSRKISPV